MLTGVRVKASLCWMFTTCENLEVLASYCHNVREEFESKALCVEHTLDISLNLPPEASFVPLFHAFVPFGVLTSSSLLLAFVCFVRAILDLRYTTCWARGADLEQEVLELRAEKSEGR